MGNFSCRVEASTDNRATRCIKLYGSITSENVGQVLLHLTSAFDEMESVLIDFSHVTKIDGAGLKLFCSCHRNLIFSRKVLHITGLDRAAMGDAILPEGSRRGAACGIDWHHSCIWLAVVE
jgi:anti-anti-sigma regulatory factor